MATYTNRKGRITAQIRKAGSDGKKRSSSKTFSSMDEAKAWVDQVQRQLKSSKRNDSVAELPVEIGLLPRYPAINGTCGVYFLFDKNECVYVGKSLNIHVRVRDHRLPRSGTKVFDSYAFLLVEPDDLDKVEAHYIAKIQPKLNDTLNPTRRRKLKVG